MPVDAITAIAIAAVLLITSASAAHAGGAGKAWTFQDFDRLDNQLNNGEGYKDGLGDLLAWGESYLMQAYVEMYRATGLERYLDKLVDHADHVLANRDDKRGFKDYSGRSRPAWSVGNQMTVAELVLRDAGGSDALKLRSTKYAYNDQTKVTIEPAPREGYFDLTLDNAYWKAHEEYKDLCMDPDSEAFVERRVNARDNVAKERTIQFSDKGSGLVTVEVDGTVVPAPVEAVSMQPLWMAYHGYSGMIVFPMLDFAWIVRNDPKLNARYGTKASRYVAEATQVFRDANREWRDGPKKGEGYYVFGEKGCPFWTDNVPKPFNYLGSEGACLIRLAQLTGDRKWRSKAEGIARLIKRHLTSTDGAAYVWNYWWGPIGEGWNRDNSPSYNTPVYRGGLGVEDTSHGALEVYFMALCADADWVFNKQDMLRLSKTFLTSILDRKQWTLNDRIDGSGEWGAHNGMVGYWMELARWDSHIAGAGITVCEKQNIAIASPSCMLSMARAIKWAAP